MSNYHISFISEVKHTRAQTRLSPWLHCQWGSFASMELCGFKTELILTENRISAERAQEQPMEIKEALSARPHRAEAAAFDAICLSLPN